MKAEDKLYEAIAVLDSGKDDRDKTARELLQQFVRANMAASAGKFNIMAFVGKDPLRPMVNGVFHEGGYKVATDHTVLCRVKSEYEPDLEGKIVDKNGVIVDQNYPNWRGVVPDTDKRGRKITLDLDKLRSICKSLILHEKEDKAAKGWRIIVGEYEGYWVKRNVLERLISFAGAMSNFRAWVCDVGGSKDSMLALKNDYGEVGLFMGVHQERVKDSNLPINILVISE